jgi:hypothetical protein
MLSAARNRVQYQGWVLEPISPEALRVDFNCGNDDLDSFYKNDLWQHEVDLITKSYVFSPEGATVKEGEPPADSIRSELRTWEKYLLLICHLRAPSIKPA